MTATQILLEAFPGSVFIPDPSEIPDLFPGPFGTCGRCGRGAYMWMLVGDEPVPMHNRCVEGWVIGEGAVDGVAVETSAAPVGVYAKWAERSGK